MGAWSTAEKRVLAIFGLTALAWVTRAAPFGGWSEWLHLPGANDASVALLLCKVAPHGVVLEAVHAPLPLLQINRVVRQVPVDDGMAVEVEVEALLTDRSAREHEWPERRIECFADAVNALDRLLVLTATCAKPQCKTAAHWEVF